MVVRGRATRAFDRVWPSVTIKTCPSLHSVVIAGGGPTGLMLAAELALARVDVAIVERRVNQRGPSEPGASPRGTHECA